MGKKGNTTKQKNQPKKKRKKNLYFTKVHENAIVEYANSNSRQRRTELYIEFIQPAFSEMVNKIIFTYKFNILPNIEVLAEECKIWLTTILEKYDPNKGSKAFSYFSVVTKNWFIHKVKKNSAKIRKEISFETLVENGSSVVIETSKANEDNNFYLEKREEYEFWNALLGQIDCWSGAKLKHNEKTVLEAVRVLLHNVEDIEIFNKKAVYLYLRELTGLNTKQVVNNLNKLREKYRIFKGKWNNKI